MQTLLASPQEGVRSHHHLEHHHTVYSWSEGCEWCVKVRGVYLQKSWCFEYLESSWLDRKHIFQEIINMTHSNACSVSVCDV